MDRDTLYLDNDEEITSIVDKLKGSDFSTIDLVVPKEALLLQSVVNLKLLKKQAESIGKEITIVTTDKVGSKLAAQIGIPVVAKVGQVPKEVKMTEAEKPNFSDEDIEMKEAPAEAPKIAEEDDLIEDTEEVVAPVAAKKAVENLPQDELKQVSRKGKTARWKKVALLSGFAAIALFVAAYIFIPLANVSVKLAASKEKVDIAFKADKSYDSVDTDAEVIPAKVVTEEKDVTEKYPTTGTKDAGEKATGTVTLYNSYDDTPQTVVAGSRLTTASGLVYRLNSNATIPAGSVTLENGKPVIKAGVLSDVDVTADQPGEKYNISPTSFKFSGFAGTAKYDTIYAQSKTAFTGGSTKTIKFVTESDVTKAKEAIAKSAEEEMRSAIAQKVGDGEQLLEDAVKLELVSAEPSVAVNKEASEFELVAKYKATAITFSEEDLKKLAESVLGDKIGSTKEIVESGSLINTTEFVDADYEKGIMNARLSGEAYIAEKINEDRLKVDLTGENEAKARETLTAIDGIENAEIRFFPAFYKRMPRLKNHIYIKTELLKN